jgi:hypothetical protein
VVIEVGSSVLLLLFEEIKFYSLISIDFFEMVYRHSGFEYS